MCPSDFAKSHHRRTLELTRRMALICSKHRAFRSTNPQDKTESINLRPCTRFASPAYPQGCVNLSSQLGKTINFLEKVEYRRIGPSMRTGRCEGTQQNRLLPPLWIQLAPSVLESTGPTCILEASVETLDSGWCRTEICFLSSPSVCVMQSDFRIRATL